MSESSDQHDSVKPSEQRGGGTPDDREASEKGPWAAKAAEPDLKDAAAGPRQSDLKSAE